MFIEINGLTKSYQKGDIKFRALDEVSFSVAQGEKCVILGPSGSGKTTLINIIGGIDRADSGEVFVDNRDIVKASDAALTEYRRNFVGFIFQFYNLIPNLTVYENVEVAANVSKEPHPIEAVLEAVGMKGLSNRFPRELSGGQQQRVAIARALVKRPQLLFCDEPTGALDFNASKEILQLLDEVNKYYNTTMLIITHNNAIAGIGEHMIRLRSGKIVEDRPNDNVIPAERIEW